MKLFVDNKREPLVNKVTVKLSSYPLVVFGSVGYSISERKFTMKCNMIGVTVE